MTDNDTAPAVPLWNWRALSEGLTGHGVDGPDIFGVGVDSRKIRPGELFVALPGDPGPRFNASYRSEVDGHDYVAAAQAAGAAGAMVHRSAQAVRVDENFPLLEVADTYDGLWALGRLARARLSGDAVAVTGSSGKTTAKHYLAAALGAYAPPGSFNNHIGVPLSLANAPADSPACVFEIGMNHPGEIEPLAAMVNAGVAIVLNVHRAHIENFSGIEALREEKLSIFKPLQDKSKAISEDVLGVGFGLTFGTKDTADARVVDLEGDIATIHFQGEAWRARVPGGGLHRAKTVAAVLLTCHLLERDLEAACSLPADLVPAGRGNIHSLGNLLVVDDSYNANPSSMAAALTGFADLQGPGPKIAVIGEMLEQGAHSEQAHLDLEELLTPMDQVFCVGRGTRPLAEVLHAPWFETADERLMAVLREATAAGGSVLIKGSNRVFWANGFVSRYVADAS